VHGPETKNNGKNKNQKPSSSEETVQAKVRGGSPGLSLQNTTAVHCTGSMLTCIRQVAPTREEWTTIVMRPIIFTLYSYKLISSYSSTLTVIKT